MARFDLSTIADPISEEEPCGPDLDDEFDTDFMNFMAEVEEYALRFVPPRKASKAVGRIKRAVCSGLEVPFSEGLALERELQQQLFISDDGREGIAAHLEKRTPEFTGK